MSGWMVNCIMEEQSREKHFHDEVQGRTHCRDLPDDDHDWEGAAALINRIKVDMDM